MSFDCFAAGLRSAKPLCNHVQATEGTKDFKLDN